jgi:hypothetical protein
MPFLLESSINNYSVDTQTFGENKMASISRVNGTPAATGAFYGLKPALVTITYANKFTADAQDGTTYVITEGGHSKAVKALEQVASIIWLGNSYDDDYFSAIVDYATFNTGAGGTTAGTYGALADALTSAIGSGTAGTYQSGVAVYTTLKSDGTWAA